MILNYRSVHPGDIIAVKNNKKHILVDKVNKNFLVTIDNQEYEYSEVEPILITSEILKTHLSAEHRKSKIYNQDEFWLGEYKWLTIKKDELGKNRLTWYDTLLQKSVEISLKYFHELQQYFYQEVFGGNRELPVKL